MQGCLTFFLSGCSDSFCSKCCVPLSQILNDFEVGIDVSSEFSIVAMLAPTGELIRKPCRIDHNPAGFHKLLDILKKEEERLKRKPIYFVESTGIFHLPLFFFLKSNDLRGFVLNPLCVHSTKNFDLRKVKNDNKDSEAIARLAKYQDVKVSMMPEPQILVLRMMTREYYAVSDMLTVMKNRLCTDLYLLFPGFLNVFSGPFGKTALTLLKPLQHSLVLIPRSISPGNSMGIETRSLNEVHGLGEGFSLRSPWPPLGEREMARRSTLF